MQSFANYSMRQHAQDMLAAFDALQITRCHLVTHSTGGIIAARMLLTQPERFGRVLALDPVTPLGMTFNADQIGLFRSMMTSRDVTRAVMATAAATLFVPERRCTAVSRGARRVAGVLRTRPRAHLRRRGRCMARHARPSQSGKGERRTRAADAGDRASPPRALGREGRLDRAGRSQDNGGHDAGLPAGRCARYRALDEPGTAGALCRRLVRRAPANA